MTQERKKFCVNKKFVCAVREMGVNEGDTAYWQ